MADVVQELRRQRALGLTGPFVDVVDRAAEEIDLMRAALTAIAKMPSGPSGATNAERAMRILATQVIQLKEQSG